MSWPNSVSTARPLPGLPSTFPGVPANDNWRMPRTNYRPPAPANDNFPQKPGRGFRLPGVGRLIPMLGVALTAYEIYRAYTEGPEQWHIPDGWVRTWYCPANNPVEKLTYRAGYCTWSVEAPPFDNEHLRQFTIGSDGGTYIGNLRYKNIHASYQWQQPTDPAPNQRPWYGPQAVPRAAALPRLGRAVLPHPMFYPPLLNPPFPAPPPIRPGGYNGPKQIMGEWPDSGYRAPQTQMEQRSTYLPSRRPPARTKERKVRAKDYAIGRTIEWLVSQATEGLDFQRALFEALPWWRKMQLYNAARQLETRYADGRIVAGRLHYRDLTPIEKAQAIYDYIDEIDAAKAVENAVKMQLTDMFWAEIGQRMGRYQTGPWDDHGFDGPPKPEPEWEWYIPDIAPDNTHNHWTYETLVNKRLTQQEAQRIHTQFDQFRSAPYQERKFR